MFRLENSKYLLGSSPDCWFWIEMRFAGSLSTLLGSVFSKVDFEFSIKEEFTCFPIMEFVNDPIEFIRDGAVKSTVADLSFGTSINLRFLSACLGSITEV